MVPSPLASSAGSLPAGKAAEPTRHMLRSTGSYWPVATGRVNSGLAWAKGIVDGQCSSRPDSAMGSSLVFRNRCGLEYTRVGRAEVGSMVDLYYVHDVRLTEM